MVVDRTSRRGNPFTIRSIVAEHQARGITLDTSSNITPIDTKPRIR